MTTPQAEKLRPSTPERYEAMSRHLLRQAEEELEKGDALQASEKIWGAVAHALKAVAQQRGWNHRFHNHLRAVAYFLAREWNRSGWNINFDAFDAMHTNLYEHHIHVGDLLPKLELARIYCQELWETRVSEPPAREPLSPAERRAQGALLRTLTRQLREAAAFGDQFTEEELEDLPPVTPTQL